jgi:hypothetical protein
MAQKAHKNALWVNNLLYNKKATTVYAVASQRHLIVCWSMIG